MSTIIAWDSNELNVKINQIRGYLEELNTKINQAEQLVLELKENKYLWGTCGQRYQQRFNEVRNSVMKSWEAEFAQTIEFAMMKSKNFNDIDSNFKF